MASKGYGILLILIAILLVILYLVGLIIAPDMVIFGGLTFSQILVRYTIFIFVLIIAGVLGYIGYLILTSPVPRPVEDIIKEYKEHTK